MSLLALSVFLGTGFAAVAPPGSKAVPEQPWVEPMCRVHARFSGKKGTFAHFGDSITVTMAFWAPLEHERRNMSPQAESAYRRVSGYMQAECWRE